MKAKLIQLGLCVTFAVMQSLTLQSQAPTWAWSVDSNGPGDELLYDIALGPDGIIYALGDFKDSFIFGDEMVAHPGPLNPNVGIPKLSKINASGEVEWVVPMYDPNLQYFFLGVSALTADSEGNAYIAGMVFRGPIQGAYSVNILGLELTVPASTLGDSFIAKIDPFGNAVWIKSIATEDHPGWCTGNQLTIDENDQIYWSATFQMDAIEIDGEVYPNLGPPGEFFATPFVTSLNADGDFLWFQVFGGTEFNGARSLAPSKGGGLLMCSIWTGATANVGGLTVENPNPLIGDNFDRWIAKMNSNGEADWLVREGGPENESTGVVAPSASGGAMVFSPVWNPTSIDDVEYDDPGYLLTRYSSDGELETVKYYSTNAPGFLSAIAYDNDNTYFLRGSLNSETFTFGDLEIGNSGGFNGTSDLMVVALDVDGNTLWSVSAGGDENELTRDIAYSPSHGVILAGITTSSALTLGGTTMENLGVFTYDFFVAALDFTSSITEKEGVERLHLFPNPVVNQFSIDLSPLQTGQHTLHIFDTRGALVQSHQAMGGQLHQVEVSVLPSGNYVVMIQSQSMVYASKLVKL